MANDRLLDASVDNLSIKIGGVYLIGFAKTREYLSFYFDWCCDRTHGRQEKYCWQ